MTEHYDIQDIDAKLAVNKFRLMVDRLDGILMKSGENV